MKVYFAFQIGRLLLLGTGLARGVARVRRDLAEGSILWAPKG